MLNSLTKNPERLIFDFENGGCTLKDLQEIDFFFRHRIETTGLIHGYAVYFDAIFKGSQKYVVLTTSPQAPPTHWWQTRFLLREPLAVNRGQLVNGYLKMRANKEQTFDATIKVDLPILNVSTPYKSRLFLVNKRDELRPEGLRLPRDAVSAH